MEWPVAALEGARISQFVAGPLRRGPSQQIPRGLHADETDKSLVLGRCGVRRLVPLGRTVVGTVMVQVIMLAQTDQARLRFPAACPLSSVHRLTWASWAHDSLLSGSEWGGPPKGTPNLGKPSNQRDLATFSIS